MEYTKDELKASKKFEKWIDIIEAIFDENESYSIELAEAIIEGFMKGRV